MQSKLKKDILIHIPAILAGYLLAMLAIHVHGNNKFERRQDAAVYVTDNNGREAELNRDIFDPNTFESVQWQYQTNQRISEIFGKTAAKEYAMDMDSLNSGKATVKQMFGDESDYCAEAVVAAYRDAGTKLCFRRDNLKAVPFPVEHCESSEKFCKAMRNAKYLVKYFEADSVPNSIVEKPSKEVMANIGAGAIIRKGRHCYMYMGVGYIDKNGRTFVADSRGRPVVASSNKKALFRYFDWSRCTVINVPKIVEYKLQHNVQRHVR